MDPCLSSTNWSPTPILDQPSGERAHPSGGVASSFRKIRRKSTRLAEVGAKAAPAGTAAPAVSEGIGPGGPGGTSRWPGATDAGHSPPARAATAESHVMHAFIPQYATSRRRRQPGLGTLAVRRAWSTSTPKTRSPGPPLLLGEAAQRHP